MASKQVITTAGWRPHPRSWTGHRNASEFYIQVLGCSSIPHFLVGGCRLVYTSFYKPEGLSLNVSPENCDCKGPRATYQLDNGVPKLGCTDPLGVANHLIFVLPGTSCGTTFFPLWNETATCIFGKKRRRGAQAPRLPACCWVEGNCSTPESTTTVWEYSSALAFCSSFQVPRVRTQNRTSPFKKKDENRTNPTDGPDLKRETDTGQ